jgi:quinoprotein glucose dehydrogenase
MLLASAAASLVLLSASSTAQEAPAPSSAMTATTLTASDWPNYGNTLGGTRYSPLDQITPANVADLKVAWTYRIGSEADGLYSSLQMTPLKVGDSVYICSPQNIVDALDAETGERRWRFDPRTDLTKGWIRACRGVTYYPVPGATGECAERIYTATIDARLWSIDAKTGKACPGFGTAGAVDLSKGMGEVGGGYYTLTSAPTLVRGKIVLGGSVWDNQKTGEPSGVVRAFDAVSGAFIWAWDMGRPGVTTEPAEGETYTRGTPNVWAPTSADEALGLVYLPTGNATPDYYGGHRRPFDDMYNSSVVALDVETGQPRWHFQTVHHDIWDYDLPAQPTLIDLPGPNGTTIPALLQASKQGQIFLLNRRDGTPLAQVEEKPVPQGAVDGDHTSPTQPFSTGMPQFAQQRLAERDMWGITLFDQLWCRIRFKQARTGEGIFTPPGLKPILNYPGTLGGVDWGGVSVDPERQLMIVNSNRLANYLQLVPRAKADAMGVKARGEPGGRVNPGLIAQANTPYAASTTPFLSPLNVPCQRPPYGELTAVDLNTRQVVWTRVLGTARDSGPFNIPSMLPFAMGTPNTGGSMITKSGLVFISATQELAFQAVDAATGKTLWKVRLPAGGQATPMSYIAPSGRQFVVLAAGGHTILQTKTGDYVIAYALPKK